jgi:FkbM family methyltransferase
MEVFRLLLPGCRTFIDVGANTGIFALVAAANDPKLWACAFEPVPLIAERLRANVRLNALRNLTVEACAVGHRDGEVTLHVPATGSSIPTSSSTLPGFKNDTQAVRVPAVTLDGYIERHRVGRIDLLKIDTETTEHLVLQGAAEMIARDEPIIICEVLRQSEPDIHHVLQHLLDRLGYRYFWITDDGLVESRSPRGCERVWLNNHLFITPEKLGPVAHLILKEPSGRTAA